MTERMNRSKLIAVLSSSKKKFEYEEKMKKKETAYLFQFIFK